MASSVVEISAGDLNSFLEFLQTEGIEEFDFTLKEDEEDLVNYIQNATSSLLNYTPFCLLLQVRCPGPE